MKNVASNIKDKLVSRYLEKKKPTHHSKSTDINVLLNRVRNDKKRVFKKKLFTFLFLTSLMLATGLFHTFN